MLLLLLVAFSCGAGYDGSAIRTATLTAQSQSQAVAWQRSHLVKARAATLACQRARYIRRSPVNHAEHSRALAYLDATRLHWKARHANCERRLVNDQRQWRRDPVAYAKQVARWLLARRGMSDQFWALDGIIMHESSWHVCAHYPSSRNCNYQGGNAYGIPQALPGSKMASMGADWRTSPLTQLRWMIRYCEQRYGGLVNAYHHRMSYGSY